MAMPRTGAAFNVKFTEEAHDGWDAAAHHHGTNITALAEAIGLELARNPQTKTLRMDTIGRAAKELARQRSRRKPSTG
jgi:hypothetical protein